MKSPIRLLSHVAFAFALAATARAADLAGKWKAEFDTQIGVQKYVFEFKAEGDKLTGKATFERQDQKGEVTLKDIKATKDDVAFTEPLKFEDQEIPITYSGKLTGDEMKLTRKVGDFATEELVAKRVKADAK